MSDLNKGIKSLEDAWLKKNRRPITLEEKEEAISNLKVFAEILIDSYLDLKRKGLVDKSGGIKNPSTSNS